MVFKVEPIEGLEQQKKKFYHDLLVDAGVSLPHDYATQDYETLYFQYLNAGAIPPLTDIGTVNARLNEYESSMKKYMDRLVNPLSHIEDPSVPLDTTEVHPYLSTPVYRKDNNRTFNFRNSPYSPESLIPWDPRRKYQVTFDAKASILDTTVYFQATWRDRNNIAIGNSPYFITGNKVPTSWTTFVSNMVPGTGNVNPPSNAAFIAPVVYPNHNSGVQGGTQWFTNFKMTLLPD